LSTALHICLARKLDEGPRRQNSRINGSHLRICAHPAERAYILLRDASLVDDEARPARGPFITSHSPTLINSYSIPMLWLGQEKERKAADAESALKIQSHTPPCTCTLATAREREKSRVLIRDGRLIATDRSL
jgi:hypothetical protein